MEDTHHTQNASRYVTGNSPYETKTKQDPFQKIMFNNKKNNNRKLRIIIGWKERSLFPRYLRAWCICILCTLRKKSPALDSNSNERYDERHMDCLSR